MVLSMNVLNNFLFQKAVTFFWGSRTLFLFGSVLVIPFSVAQSATEVLDCKSLWDKASYNKEAYTRGLNPSLILKHLIHQLKTPGVSAKTTHIEELKPLALKHINFIEEGISLRETTPVTSIRNRVLNSMRNELDDKHLKKELTYEWWLFFNWKLAIVSYNNLTKLTANKALIPEILDANAKSESLLLKYNNTLISRYIQGALEDFPSFILLPVTGSSGILTINKAMVDRIHYAGLMHDPAYADGVLIPPDKYFDHDLVHHNVTVSYQASEEEEEFYTQLLEQIQTLKGNKRNMAELEFFLLLHEEGPPPHERQKNPLLDIIVKRFKDINNLGIFLPQNLPRNEKDIKHFLKHTSQVFSQAAEALPKNIIPDWF